MIDLLLKATELKEEKRTGWELRKVTDPETVADHSWGTAFLCLIYAENEEVDTDKAVKMAVVHDLAEAEIGDIPSRAVDAKKEMSKEEKIEKEEQVINKFSEDLGSQIKELFHEYEKRETDTAVFVKDMDMIELCLQALKYEKQGRYNKNEENGNFIKYSDMDEFFANTGPLMKTDTGQELFQNIKKRYEKAKKE